MPDDEQEVNCIVGACCGGDDGEKRKRALASWLARQAHISLHAAGLAADAILDGFDLAPKHTLDALISRIAELARGNPYR